jgi:hypothetical protein
MNARWALVVSVFLFIIPCFAVAQPVEVLAHRAHLS